MWFQAIHQGFFPSFSEIRTYGLSRICKISARKSLAVLVLDIDRFKSLNEIVGPKAADAALRQMSARLRSILAPSDVLARWGGDEFAILARSLSGTSSSAFQYSVKILFSFMFVLRENEHYDAALQRK